MSKKRGGLRVPDYIREKGFHTEHEDFNCLCDKVEHNLRGIYFQYTDKIEIAVRKDYSFMSEEHIQEIVREWTAKDVDSKVYYGAIIPRDDLECAYLMIENAKKGETWEEKA